LGPQNGEISGFYSIFVVGGTNFRIINFGFLAFFEAKMTKIVILDQKQIVPNDYQHFWVHFDWFLSLSQTSDVKYLSLTVQAKSTQKLYFLVSNHIFLWYFGPPPHPM